MLLTCVCGYLLMPLVSGAAGKECSHLAPKILSFNVLDLSRHVRFKQTCEEQQVTFVVRSDDNKCALLPCA